jgi:hypothetical protein
MVINLGVNWWGRGTRGGDVEIAGDGVDGKGGGAQAGTERGGYCAA